MSNQLVSAWLGLPPEPWPPDHYTLLGLARGETDVGLIENQVHERLLRLRPYQLNHPEEVTEAMNRLARAFSCLTDPLAKKAYDEGLFAPNSTVESTDSYVDPLAWLFGPWSELATPRPAVRAGNQKLADWREAPPPPRLPSTTSSPTPAVPRQDTGNGAPPLVSSAPPIPTGPLDTFIEAARSSAARRGLSSRRALYRRMRRTRQLLRAWERGGKYLNRPLRRLVRSGEAAELSRMLGAISRRLEDFPPLLGRLGQPGFWVASLARHDMVVPIFRMLVPSQRETLARDWRDGRQILHAHRSFLLVEARVFRNQSWWGRVKRRVRFLFEEHPSLWAVVVLCSVALFIEIVAAIMWLNG